MTGLVRSGLRAILRAEDGPLTEQLRLAPAGGGLGLLPQSARPEALASSVCGFCSTGCGLDLHVRGGIGSTLTPSPAYPVNRGAACPKGWEALAVLDSPDRATTPLLRRDGRTTAVDWDTALRTMTERFRSIQERHGPEAVAFLGTGQLPTEELAWLGALGKFGMGMLHGDGNTRQCMASAVVAYKESFGFDAPPYTYADLEESDVIVLVGSNLCIAHPILWERVVHNRHSPEIVVVDPRRTETAMQSTWHIAPRPKSDLTLFYAVARVLIERDWVRSEYVAAHTRGYEAFAEFVRGCEREQVEQETGIPWEQVERLAELIHRGRRVSFWWTMGVNQSHQGVRTAQALINLALLTGNVGRPGTGANSITGQCNAMGSRLFSNTTSLFGGRDFANESHRREVAEILGIDTSRIPDRPSWPYHRILEGVLRGEIRGLWIVGTNPAHSWINQHQVRDILGRLEFLVVQDMYSTTETMRLADLALPAAAWGEKEGTFINSERRIGMIRRVRPAPGEALSDFSIFRLVAEYWGCGELFRRWQSPADVFSLLRELSAGRPCDFTAVPGYQALEQAGGIQWPCPAGTPLDSLEPQRRLFADGKYFHEDERARFIYDPPRPLPEPPDARYPLLLITGRGTAAQWHTQTRTAKSAVLRKLSVLSPIVELHPFDARELGVAADERIWVVSQRGRALARAVLTPTVARGQVFMPMHDEQTNQLTHPAFDPHSSQPAYKACAVRIERQLGLA